MNQSAFLISNRTGFQTSTAILATQVQNASNLEDQITTHPVRLRFAPADMVSILCVETCLGQDAFHDSTCCLPQVFNFTNSSMVYSGTSPSGKMSQVRAEGVTKHSVIEANRGCVQGEWKGGRGKGSGKGVRGRAPSSHHPLPSPHPLPLLSLPLPPSPGIEGG